MPAYRVQCHLREKVGGGRGLSNKQGNSVENADKHSETQRLENYERFVLKMEEPKPESLMPKL